MLSCYCLFLFIIITIVANLRKACNVAVLVAGINAEHLQQLADGLEHSLLTNAATPPGSAYRAVVIMLDEMHVHEGIVEDPKTGEWVGFVGDEDAVALKDDIEGGQQLLANKVLFAMVRNVYGSSWSYPLAYWAYR